MTTKGAGRLSAGRFVLIAVIVSAMLMPVMLIRHRADIEPPIAAFLLVLPMGFFWSAFFLPSRGQDWRAWMACVAGPATVYGILRIVEAVNTRILGCEHACGTYLVPLGLDALLVRGDSEIQCRLHCL